MPIVKLPGSGRDGLVGPSVAQEPFTWTKTADEILKSLADYLTKVTPPAIKNQQET
ncbi:hypothetical protein [Streptomyces sp. YS415]|uniref:hypothetical protein n=1 Tax=Streptomyces sp. YS415 TaxID=2944806 RepID=UPI002022097F|nr:hypothetical protein [Streptomyces sp. YS415]MCL7428916.1 hypothetical protein [Streptomyces sp. YS415]